MKYRFLCTGRGSSCKEHDASCWTLIQGKTNSGYTAICTNYDLSGGPLAKPLLIQDVDFSQSSLLGLRLLFEHYET